MLQERTFYTDTITPYLLSLRDHIIASFETFESHHRFIKTPWEYSRGSGGGEMAVLRGDTFEKAAVNWSKIAGDSLPFSKTPTPFIATGVSLITHMQNPFMPTVHMNVRYLETAEGYWFGGGYDLTPMGFDNTDDICHFHATAKHALGDTLYTQFSQQAADYFFIKHRNKQRGAGGIFFDHYHTGDIDEDYALWSHIGNHFLPAIMPIYEKRKNSLYGEHEKSIQNTHRAHYVEFNLIYDKGTKFGFLSGGNPEAILCSMPPMATW